MILMYVLYIKNHFDKSWHKVIAFSQFKSELEAWLEVNWVQYRGGKVPVIEFEDYYRDKVKKGEYA